MSLPRVQSITVRLGGLTATSQQHRPTVLPTSTTPEKGGKTTLKRAN